MKLSKSVRTIYLRKDELQGRRWVHALGPVKHVSAGMFKPSAIKGLPHTQGTFVEYRAVRTFTTRLKKIGSKKRAK